METFSALLAVCAGNSPFTDEFPAQRPVTRSFDVFFDLRLNKRLSKRSRGWWFETLLCRLWRHCNVRTREKAVMAAHMVVVASWILLVLHHLRFGSLFISNNVYHWCTIICIHWKNEISWTWLLFIKFVKICSISVHNYVYWSWNYFLMYK